jgi:PKD repeat protein
LDGTIVSYAWDFGDGQTGSGPVPSHSYKSTGRFWVRLTVTDSAGQTGTFRHLIEIYAPRPCC